MNNEVTAKIIENPGELSPEERQKWLDLYMPLDHRNRLKIIYLLIDQLHNALGTVTRKAG